MKTLIAAALILTAGLAGAETKAKQATPQAPVYQNNGSLTIGPYTAIQQPADDDIASMTILLDVDGFLLNSLAGKYSGLDPEFDHVSQLYSDTVNLYTAAIAADGPMDFTKARKSAHELFVNELLMLREAKDKK